MSAAENFLFQMRVTGSPPPKGGLDEVSDWLCPQTWQYCSLSSISEPQYQQVFIGRHCIRRVHNSIWDGPGRALSDRGGLAAGSYTRGPPVLQEVLTPRAPASPWLLYAPS